MQTDHADRILYAFGTYRLDPGERVLLRDSQPVPLTPKAFETLVALVERSGRVVDKDALLRRVWPDTSVEEATLAQNIFTLRKTLGDTSATPRYIETVPKIGYRFVASVERLADLPDVGHETPAGATIPTPRRIRWWTVAALVVVLAVAGTLLVQRFTRAAPTGRIMLAVMPFENLSGDATQEYLSDGLTEEMITQLGQLSPGRLGVIARTTAMTYLGTHKTVADIGRELHVDYLLEGSVRKVGDHVRVSAQLIAVRDQTHLWAENYDRDVRDLLALESGVAGAIAREVEVNVTPASRARLAQTRTVNPDAYDLYLRGRYFWNKRTPDGRLAAREYFQRAISRDPSDARSYAALAETFAGEVWGPQQTIGEPAVTRALALDDTLPEAHRSSAILKMRAHEWTIAEREFLRAIDLDPNSAQTRLYHAESLQAFGRNDEALAEVERALELDPLSVLAHQAQGSTMYFARRYDAAEKALQTTLALDPDFFWAHVRLGRVYEQQNRFLEAEREFKPVLAVDPTFADMLRTYTYALSGRTYEARARLSILARHDGPKILAAAVCAALGETSTAFDWLGQAVDEHDFNVRYLKVDPGLDPLRHDPRFAALLRRAGLE